MVLKNTLAMQGAKVQDEGAVDAYLTVLIGSEDGAPNFIMRRVDVQPGGCTPRHSHAWEHVIYVLYGSGSVQTENGEFELAPGGALLILPNEVHQFKAIEKTSLSFLCSIPRR
ncbi:MAG: cupin domain-containing protein [bacterium]